MKKLFFVGALVLSAALARGEWMYWTIDFDDELAGENPIQAADGTMQAMLYAQNGDASVTQLGGSLESGASWLGGGDDPVVVPFGADGVDYAGYTFYIELMNGSKVYRSNDLSRDVMGEYFASSLEDFNTTWNAAVGTTWSTVVPEPTSGLLLLLGVAGLALKRKRA